MDVTLSDQAWPLGPVISSGGVPNRQHSSYGGGSDDWSDALAEVVHMKSTAS
jgi:hypothetical protein